MLVSMCVCHVYLINYLLTYLHVTLRFTVLEIKYRYIDNTKRRTPLKAADGHKRNASVVNLHIDISKY